MAQVGALPAAPATQVACAPRIPHDPAMAERTDWYIVVNPAAAGGRGARRWERLTAALLAARIPFEAALTSSAADGWRLAAAARRAGFRRFLVAGGDGSLHDVVNGLAADGLAGLAECTVGVAPHGTGNDWARFHRIPADPARIAALLAAGIAPAHDVGELRWPGTGRPATLFVNIAGAGFDAHVIQRVRGGLPGRLAYPWAAVTGFRSYRVPEFNVTADGRNWQGRGLVVLATIGAYCGGGMHVAPAADPGDGLAEVVAIRELGAASILRRLPKLFDGRIGGDAAVTSFGAQRLGITAEPPCGVEADGQYVGETPVEVVVHRGAMRALTARTALAGGGFSDSAP
jgi:diacylglycerol kinase (ATP)